MNQVSWKFLNISFFYNLMAINLMGIYPGKEKKGYVHAGT